MRDTLTVNFARIKPVRIHAYNRDWHVDVVRVVGYKSECDCGWSSRTSATVVLAREELRQHRVEGCSKSG